MVIVKTDESGYYIKNKKGTIIKAQLEDLKETEAEYKIPVTWEMCGKIKISAKSAEKAILKQKKSLTIWNCLGIVNM